MKSVKPVKNYIKEGLPQSQPSGSLIVGFFPVTFFHIFIATNPI
jgi:hypothetical protein